MKSTKELEQMLYKNETVADKAPAAIPEAERFCEGYKVYLNRGKTERVVNRLSTACGRTAAAPRR